MLTRPLSDFPPPERDIQILYQDADLIVVSKPAWLLSVPGRGADKIDSVAHRVQQIYPEARSTHRLDFATSGIIVLGMHLAAEREIHRQFRERLTHKRYIAIVDGLVEQSDQTIDLPMRCDLPNRPKQMIDLAQGKSARTQVIVAEHLSDCSRLILLPITGRSHQLRLHCQAMGHPILGDWLYAPEPVKQKSPRLLLHAEMLSLLHPRTQVRLEFVDPTPF